jgi:peptidoglycan/LPS O-acetylase OafA/YrhL
MKRLTNLDVIKIIAAILIVFHHYQQTFEVTFNGINFFGGTFPFAYLVELFFMISGFVTVYGDKKEDRHYLRSFGHKCLRIYPYVWLACIVFLVITYSYYFLFGEWMLGNTYGLINILASFLLIHEGWWIDIKPAINNPTWYLCVLLLCYIVFYLVKWISSKTQIPDFAFYILIITGSVLAMYFEINLPLFMYATQRGYIAFFLGGLICRCVQRLTTKQICVIQGVLLLAILGVAIRGYRNWYVLVLLLHPTIVFGAVNFPQIQIKKNIISYAGGVSFEVYIWHPTLFLVVRLLSRMTGIQVEHTYFTMILYTIFVEVVAFLVYRYFELPVSKKLRQIL